MPQLVPFYFVNEVFFTFVVILVLIFILSKFILPSKVRLFISRLFIKKI
jgi:F-type H+-transporting ATPase subunit 8